MKLDQKVTLAKLFETESIIELDQSIIGSRSREKIIREAVYLGQCYVIAVQSGIAAFGILNYHFYRHGFIELLIVGTEYRRRGFGRMLVDTFIELCETEKIFTSTNSSNIPMQKLLESCGFIRCGWIDKLDEDDPELVYCFER